MNIETARVKELLGLQIGVVRDLAARLDAEDLEQVESIIADLEDELQRLRSMVEGLPHRHG